MIWAQIIYYVVTLILSIALSPRPQKPKSAAIDDFEFPTAEEGRPIPVVFGEVDITGPNVLWYGALQVRAIKKRSGFSKATVGYKYYIGFHAGLCHGPVDAVTYLGWDGKQAWTGNITANGSGTVAAPDLFGGSGRGGGVEGEFDIAMGADSQTANAYLAANVVPQTSPPEPIPAFRGILSLIWKGGWVGNSEFIKPFTLRVRRILQGWEGVVWYSSRATINTRQMNPAHIIYQAMTDTNWGMGVPAGRINDTNFRAVADTLFDEGFGLQLIWTQSQTIEQFLQIVLDHIGGGLSFRLDTGQYELTLFRGGYDPEDLTDYDQSEVMSLTRYEVRGIGEIVNEVTLTYTDPDTRLQTTITGQDLANVDSQGARIPAIIDLKGIRDHTIARVVLGRELAQRTMPLAKIVFTINRNAWFVGFGDLFRFTWPERQCFQKVFRVLKISKGTLQDNTISIEAMEDIYQYSVGTGLDHQSGSGNLTPPPTPPDDDDNTASVISTTTTTPPVSPADGDRYYSPPGSTGAWSGEVGLQEWDEAAGEWIYTPLDPGTIFYVDDDDETVQIDGDGDVVPFGGGGGYPAQLGHSGI